MKRLLLTSGIVAVGLAAIAAGPWPPDDMKSVVDFDFSDPHGNRTALADIRHGKALVVAYGAPWCGYSQRQIIEMAKLRQDFDARDLALVQVVVGGDAADMGEGATGLLMVGDPDASIARSNRLEGVPVVQVVDPYGKIVWEKNFTPRAWLRDRVKVALATLDRPLAPGSIVGRAQTLCPVDGVPYDRETFVDLPVDDDAEADAERVVEVHRIYLATADARAEFGRNTTRYLGAMAARSVTPEKVWIVRRPGSDLTPELCRPCGSIKGSVEFLKFWSQPRASCIECRRLLGSKGCCLSNDELAGSGLCPACGYAKDDPACCALQGRELCPKCGLERVSKGCCKIV